MIDLRLPTGFPTTSTTRLPRSPPLPDHPPPDLTVRHRIHREVARPAGRGVDAAPVAPPFSVGRNVDPAAAAAHALRPLRRQPVGALVHSVAGMRSNVLEPHRPAIAIGPHEPQGR